MTAVPEPPEAVPAGDRYPSKPAYERLLAELIPTGTFGHALPPPAPEPRPITPWTPEEQARHLADLDAALDGWEWDDDYAERRRDRERERAAHLRLITDPDAA